MRGFCYLTLDIFHTNLSKKNIMKSIPSVLRITNKLCHCGGKIAESFSQKIKTNTRVVVGGPPKQPYVTSDGYTCLSCGLRYGEPMFINTEPTEQVRFELSLSVGTVACLITSKDIKPKEVSVLGKEIKIKVGNTFITGNTLVSKKEPSKVPQALKKMTVGKTVYIVPNEDYRRDIHNPYYRIQLTKKLHAEQFLVKRSCIN